MRRWEEQLNQILNAIVNSDYIKEQRSERDVKGEIEFYGVQNCHTAFEVETLESFFEQDTEDMLKINELWLWLKEKAKDQISWVLGDAETFVKEGLDFEMEDFTSEKLTELSKELSTFYEKCLDAEWKGLTPDEAKSKLPENQLYIALLGKDGKVIREPHPITRNTKAKLTWEIKEKTVKSRFDGAEKKERSIIVTIQPPPTTHKSFGIRLRKTEVKATTIVH